MIIAVIFRSECQKYCLIKALKPSAASNNVLAPVINYIDTKIRVKFDGTCLKQERLTFTYKKVVNSYIVYKINACPYALDTNFELKHSLFGATKLITNTDPEKYKYSGYGIGFGPLGLVKMLYYLVLL